MKRIVWSVVMLGLACTKPAVEGAPTLEKRSVRPWEVIRINAADGAADFTAESAVHFDQEVVEVELSARTLMVMIPGASQGAHELTVAGSKGKETKLSVDVLAVDEAAVAVAISTARQTRLQEIDALEAELEFGVPATFDAAAMRAELERLRVLVNDDARINGLPADAQRQLAVMLWANEQALSSERLAIKPGTSRDPLVIGASCANELLENGERCLERNFNRLLLSIPLAAAVGSRIGEYVGRIIGGSVAIPGIGNVVGQEIGEWIGGLTGIYLAIYNLNAWLIRESGARVDAVADSLTLLTTRDVNPFRVVNTAPRSFPIQMQFQPVNQATLGKSFSVPQQIAGTYADFAKQWNKYMKLAPVSIFSFDASSDAKIYTPKRYLSVELPVSSKNGWTFTASIVNDQVTVAATKVGEQPTTFDVVLKYNNPGVDMQQRVVTFTVEKSEYACTFTPATACAAPLAAATVPVSAREPSIQGCLGVSLSEATSVIKPGLYGVEYCFEDGGAAHDQSQCLSASLEVCSDGYARWSAWSVQAIYGGGPLESVGIQDGFSRMRVASCDGYGDPVGLGDVAAYGDRVLVGITGTSSGRAFFCVRRVE